MRCRKSKFNIQCNIGGAGYGSMVKAKLDALADITSPNQGLIGGTLHAGQPVLWSEVNIEDVGLFQTSCNILCGQVLEACKNIKIYQK